ncbi:hypothetical protein LFAB_06510 [Lactiplantibacillus fabifermentans T30PCM01]|uniref:Uncharacterized protein n=1 Tax=Lactiplantibacillus fabifermentans T30PCM01 TaxID=1400520 RepID=W6TCK9_9LACO|nr:hypothetical protein LFAB_06510 [Lactiplantibacillus fabifermentans T30PCM01]
MVFIIDIDVLLQQLGFQHQFPSIDYKKRKALNSIAKSRLVINFDTHDKGFDAFFNKSFG